MIKLRFNPIALDDLTEIKEYISQDNIDAAIRTLNDILNKIQSLIDFPEIGASLSNKVGIKTNYRYLICGQYIIFYTFENKAINVGRILHGKRDYINFIDLI